MNLPENQREWFLWVVLQYHGTWYTWGGDDPLGFDCLAKGTLIKTLRGDISIEKVNSEDFVLTRGGYRRVLSQWLVREKAEIIQVHMPNGRLLSGTPDHRVWTENKGWKTLDSLRSCDIFLTCERSLNSMACASIATQNPDMKRSVNTSSGQDHRYIERYGKSIMVIFQKAMKSIMLMVTRLITRLKILPAFYFLFTVNKPNLAVSSINSYAFVVGNLFTHTVTGGLKGDSALKSASELNSTKSIGPIYDLCVENNHEFYANGILVHNCSGLVIEALKSAGRIKRKSDYTADGLWKLFREPFSKPQVPKCGSLCFWFDRHGRAVHVAVCINEDFYIGAEGGGSHVKTIEDAIKANAFIKLRPLSSRPGAKFVHIWT